MSHKLGVLISTPAVVETGIPELKISRQFLFDASKFINEREEQENF